MRMLKENGILSRSYREETEGRGLACVEDEILLDEGCHRQDEGHPVPVLQRRSQALAARPGAVDERPIGAAVHEEHRGPVCILC